MELTSEQKHNISVELNASDIDETVPFLNKVLAAIGYIDRLDDDSEREELRWTKRKEPLIKDEKKRKAARAWAEANGFSVFKVYNQHFNYVKIHGVKDRYDPNGSNIEFMGTIAGAEKRAYEIDELCGEEKE